MNALDRPDLHDEERQRGFVVVAALWILAALATLVGIFAVYVSTSAVSMSMHGDRVRGEAAVRAALELVAYQVSAAEGGGRTAGSVGVRLARANAVASFRSETARIDLNKAPKELLIGLFRSLGASTAEAEDQAARVEAWRKRPAAGATSDEPTLYRGAGLRYVPRENAFQHAGELASVMGISESLAAQAMPLVTVYSGEAGINISIASPEVIAALPGMTPERLEQLLEARRLPGAERAVPALLGANARYTTGGDGGALRVTVSADLDNGKRMGAEIVIITLAGDSEPYRVLSWSGELELATAKR